MKMASRNIANMHLFLEMKKKFPDLPEDTLRNYVFLYAEDQNKCVSLLQKESKNHFHSSQLFSEFRLPENQAIPKKNGNIKMNIDKNLGSRNCNAVILQNNTSNQESSIIEQSNAPNIFLQNKSSKQECSLTVQSNDPNVFLHNNSSHQESTIKQQSDAPNLSIPNNSNSQESAVKHQSMALNVFLQNTSSNQQSSILQPSDASNLSGRSTSHTGIVHVPLKSPILNMPFKNEVKSAPVLSNFDRPFSKMYNDMPVSSHVTMGQVPSDRDNRMMFSTTKEHTIPPLETLRVHKPAPCASREVKPSQQHAVKLSITPSFPFPQQQMSVYTSAISASTSHSSKPGRHTTSLNLQLQPHSADPYPVEISTIPTNIGSPCNFSDFGSHLQISVGAQGATFTALRLQRPQVTQNQTTVYSSNQLPAAETASFNFSQSPSQPEESKAYKFMAKLQQDSGSSINGKNFLYDKKDTPSVGNKVPNTISDFEYQTDFNRHGDLQSGIELPSEKLNAQTNFCHGFQASPDYMMAVKKHQLARLDLVREELNKGQSTCSKLKSEVNELEHEIVQRREKKSSFSYAELLKKLKEENRKLRIECNCLLMEYDIESKGQIPVGMTDEDFYSNIFTGPNDGLTLYSNGKKNSKEEMRHPATKLRSPTEEDENDERNRWKCKKCTFANHKALQICEMCELPRNSGYVEYNSNYSSSSHLRIEPSSEDQPRRAVGSVQILVTRRAPSNSNSVKLQLTHRIPR